MWNQTPYLPSTYYALDNSIESIEKAQTCVDDTSEHEEVSKTQEATPHKE